MYSDSNIHVVTALRFKNSRSYDSFINYCTSNKKHFKEMNSYVRMTMVKKEQGQDDYSILLTLPAYISPLMSSTYVGWKM